MSVSTRLRLFCLPYSGASAQVVIGVVQGGSRALHHEGARLGQLIHVDAQGLQGLRGQVAAHAHAVIPTGEEEIHIGVEQGFHRRVLARQLRQTLEQVCHFRGHRLPAGDAAVAGHVRLEAHGEHHLGHVDVVEQHQLAGLGVEGARGDGQAAAGPRRTS